MPGIAAVLMKHSKVYSKKTEGQHSPVWLEKPRLVIVYSRELRTWLFIEFAGLEKKYMAYDQFLGNDIIESQPRK